MITEDYVSVETAKLLNIKGFKGEFHKHYWGYEPGKEFLTDSSFNPEYDYPAPTLQVARKWLRELHKIDIIVTPSMFRGKYNVYIYKDENLCGANFDGATLSPSYEKAADAAIKYCLENLI